MRVKFTGQFRELHQFVERVQAMPSVLPTVNKQLAEETLDLIKEGFERKQDPYGRKWKGHAPLTQEVRPGGNILEDTGGLKASWFFRSADAHVFRIGNPKPHAGWMQFGTGVHGPSKKRIRPRRGRALRIPVRGGGAIYAKSVAGAPPRRMVPSKGRLPAGWKRRYVETAQDVLTELFRK